MNQLHFPWLELSILVPLVGAVFVGRLRDADSARKWSLLFSGLALAFVLAGWGEFSASRGHEAVDPWHVVPGAAFLVVDDLNAPLLALTALLFLLTAVATLRTKVRRYSFAWNLASQSIMLATLSCKEPWGIIGLLAVGTVPPFLELRARNQRTGVYVAHMALFLVLLTTGWALVEFDRGHDGLGPVAWWAVGPLLGAIFIRAGLVPVHCWMTDLFEHATFGTALLFVTPMPAAYAALRLLVPIAPGWVLTCIGLVALITAVYAAGMALVQLEARRFFCYLFLSHSALVFVGMDTTRQIGLTGALCVWLSIGLALAGFGLILRALEARHGRLTLTKYHGLYEHMPSLAVCFLLTGLASVGFPGTFGFLGTELLVDGVVDAYPYVGVAVVLVAALNGIAVVRAYFLLFTGTRHASSVSLEIGPRERIVVLALIVLIVCGGLFPQPFVASRHHAAEQILATRDETNVPAEGETHEAVAPVGDSAKVVAEK